MPSRKKISVALFAALCSPSAFAADLPKGAAAPPTSASPAAAPDIAWVGFYVGANGGYAGQLGGSRNFAAPSGYFAAMPTTSGEFTFKQPAGGFAGGVEAGYNFQIGSWVVGVENDFTYVDAQRASAYVFNGSGALPSGFHYVGSESAISWVATGRARVGYAINNLLIYGTAGLAFGAIKGGYCGSDSCSATKSGYAAGAGLEYAFSQNWSVKVEGLYVNLGSTTPGVFAVDGSGRAYSDAGRKFENDLAIGRVGINYRF